MASTAENWKVSGNNLFKSGQYLEAVTAYSMGITGIRFGSESDGRGPPDILATLYANSAAAFLKLKFYREARKASEEALNLDSTNEKARFRLATALYHLRFYEDALNALRPLQRYTTTEIQNLLRILIVCNVECRTGEYDIARIQQEEKLNARLDHADFCSPLVELKKSAIGGRGMFAKEAIPQGTLLVASKAIASVFESECDVGEHIKSSIIVRVYEGLERSNGKAIFNLEGGYHQHDINIDLRKFDFDSKITASEIGLKKLGDIVTRNCFGIAKVHEPDDEGLAVFHVPSFFNHSCMPNTFYYTIGDMIFIKSAADIASGSELFLSYLEYFEVKTADERNKKLANR